MECHWWVLITAHVSSHLSLLSNHFQTAQVVTGEPITFFPNVCVPLLGFRASEQAEQRRSAKLYIRHRNFIYALLCELNGSVNDNIDNAL